jgi:hypothetical protein
MILSASAIINITELFAASDAFVFDRDRPQRSSLFLACAFNL